jgi:hypothetical protein
MFSRRTNWKLTPNRFSEAQREVRESGKELVDLTISNPTGRACPRRKIILDSLSSEAMDYDPQPKVWQRWRRWFLLSRQSDGFESIRNRWCYQHQRYSYVFACSAIPAMKFLVPAGYPRSRFSPTSRT